MLISKQVDLRTRNITKNEERQYIIFQNTILKVYALNKRTSK